MLERGGEELRRADLRNLVLIRGDATALPFRDASFDAACCFAALHLFADPFAALDEMRRVLKPGGRIALMTSVRRELTLRPLKPVLERASGMRIFEGDEIVGALEQRGFTGIHRRLSGMVQFVGGGSLHSHLAGHGGRSMPSPTRPSRPSAVIGKTRTVTRPAAMKPAEVAASIRPRSWPIGSRRR